MEEQTVKPLPLPPAGTSRKRPLVMEEGPCMFEYAITKDILDTQPTRWAYMDTLYGITKRMVVRLWVFHNNRPTEVYADVVTGTVFLGDGSCLSSNQRRIVRWGVYESLRNKEKQAGRTLLQERWNKGL